MEEGLINISHLNDFVFCPASIYFHALMKDINGILYASEKQMKGKNVHERIDKSKYSTSRDVMTSLDIYSQIYGLVGKIDIFDKKEKRIIERKKHISKIYDGQIYQLYAQYICLREMGYDVERIRIYSYDDNKSYDFLLSELSEQVIEGFYSTIGEIRNFDMENFIQNNKEKCNRCVYVDMCDRCKL